MTENEKIIERLYEDGSFPLTWADKITKALLKTEAKKPTSQKKYMLVKCPECDNTNIYVGMKYCSECGQKLNWEDLKR